MLAGLIIGIGMILPGVSGGVLAVVLGVYEKIIYSINNFKDDIKGNIKFLTPIGLGVVVGAILSANLLKYVFETYYVESCFTFMGLILGCIPFLIRDVKTKDEKGVNYIVLIVTLVLSLVLTLVSKNSTGFEATVNGSFASILKFFLAGVFYVMGKVVPGISSSFMLMMIGMYTYFLSMVSNPLAIFSENLVEVIALGVGAIVGAIFFIKLMAILLKKYYRITYSIIIGFVVGSVVAIYPDKFSIFGVLFFVFGFVVAYWFSKPKNN